MFMLTLLKRSVGCSQIHTVRSYFVVHVYSCMYTVSRSFSVWIIDQL